MTTKKKTVWETLSPIDVSAHTEEKNGFTYLSWAWAWSTLKDQYPDATYTKHTFNYANGWVPYMSGADGSAYVMVTVKVDGEEATEVFPVLDYKNQAIMNPNSFQVNTALQRCLAKVISILGLGAYIYAGEDLPPVKADSEVKIVSGDDTKVAKGGNTIFEIFKTFMASKDTVKELEAFYQTNTEAVRALKTLDVSKYEEMIALFKNRKEEILAANKPKKEKA